jgi:hypothetical protein
MMAYPSSLTSRQAGAIGEITTKMEELPSGETLLVKHDNAIASEEIRYLLYAWLFQGGLKEDFRISRINPKTLLVQRKASLKEVARKADKAEMFAASKLMGIADREKASEVARKARDSGEITDAELVKAMELWDLTQEK